jgi:hypothetical protein
LEIKEVQTNEEYKKVAEYLRSKRMPKPNSIMLYYAIGDDGNIIGVSGFEYVPIIEPLCANSGTVASKLYDTVMEAMKSKVVRINADRLESYISDDKIEYMKPLCEKMGFRLIEKTNRFTKSLI